MVDHKPTGERYRADQIPEGLDKEDLTWNNRNVFNSYKIKNR